MLLLLSISQPNRTDPTRQHFPTVKLAAVSSPANEYKKRRAKMEANWHRRLSLFSLLNITRQPRL